MIHKKMVQNLNPRHLRDENFYYWTNTQLSFPPTFKHHFPHFSYYLTCCIKKKKSDIFFFFHLITQSSRLTLKTKTFNWKRDFTVRFL